MFKNARFTLVTVLVILCGLRAVECVHAIVAKVREGVATWSAGDWFVQVVFALFVGVLIQAISATLNLRSEGAWKRYSKTAHHETDDEGQPYAWRDAMLGETLYQATFPELDEGEVTVLRHDADDLIRVGEKVHAILNKRAMRLATVVHETDETESSVQ